MKKRSVKIAGHATSITLEDSFWEELNAIAARQGKTLSALITDIDSGRGAANLSSALRVYILENLKTRNL